MHWNLCLSFFFHSVFFIHSSSLTFMHFKKISSSVSVLICWSRCIFLQFIKTHFLLSTSQRRVWWNTPQARTPQGSDGLIHHRHPTTNQNPRRAGSRHLWWNWSCTKAMQRYTASVVQSRKIIHNDILSLYYVTIIHQEQANNKSSYGVLSHEVLTISLYVRKIEYYDSYQCIPNNKFLNK